MSGVTAQLRSSKDSVVHQREVEEVFVLAPEFWTAAVFQIMLSPDARNTAWVSFDGRKRQEICHGDRSDLSSDCILSKYRKS